MEQHKNTCPERREAQLAAEFDQRILKIIEDAEAAIAKSCQALQKIKAVIEGGDLCDW